MITRIQRKDKVDILMSLLKEKNILTDKEISGIKKDSKIKKVVVKLKK